MTSSTTSQIVEDNTGLNRLKSNLAKAGFVKVGYLASGKAQEDHGGITNVAIACIAEFGSISQNIPIRSTLRMPIETKMKDIQAFIASKKMQALILAGKTKEALTLLGIKGEQVVQQAYETGGFGKWKPLKAATIRRKGSSSILIDTGQLRRAVTSEVKNENA